MMKNSEIMHEQTLDGEFEPYIIIIIYTACSCATFDKFKRVSSEF